MRKTQIQSAPLLREHAVGRALVVELYGEIDILTAVPVSARLDVARTQVAAAWSQPAS
ncbi:hypothetical protein GCM10011579_001260 [Streptomyces albiflavescens]|uniref:Uncharacterized protein n=1 Tax=Streptomyces albiflavescens TaxID=1623582 RepID=A0A917XRI9_9ACTN|nr:hypothetical protein [Streptomyces albiflavescens]GGN48528.1 hypothetical protein GCM10011579_001260 [Streptomyces albiflavescens]